MMFLTILFALSILEDTWKVEKSLIKNWMSPEQNHANYQKLSRSKNLKKPSQCIRGLHPLQCTCKADEQSDLSS